MRSVLIRSSLLLSLLIASSASAVTIDWTEVRGANAPDTTGYGAVPNRYRIGTYEVTNAQYAEFLNAVAASDTNGLYNTNMGDVSVSHGGIVRSGSSGSYSYSSIAGRENLPVNLVSFWDAARFANWLHNGQPTGPQDNSTTEDGAYTLTPDEIFLNSITRNEGARIFLPSEDEWYKAAYYDAVSMSYFADPTGSDGSLTCSGPTSVPHRANCLEGGPGDLTAVGSYTGSASPYGTFDQGGNVYEWSETIFEEWNRVVRGGSWDAFPDETWTDARWDLVDADAEFDSIGFRLATITIPEPSTGLLVIGGLLGLAAWRRVHA